MITMTELRTQILDLADRIEVPDNLLPAFDSVDKKPYVDIDLSGQLSFMAKERGEEVFSKSTYDTDELLYAVFSSITYRMAVKYESKNSIKGQDSRRSSFKKQIELLNILNKAWAETKQKEHHIILQQAPFDDMAIKRANLTTALLEKGLSPSDAREQAFEKYPL